MRGKDYLTRDRSAHCTTRSEEGLSRSDVLWRNDETGNHNSNELNLAYENTDKNRHLLVVNRVQTKHRKGKLLQLWLDFAYVHCSST